MTRNLPKATDFPARIQWDICHECNNKCIYCHKRYLSKILNSHITTEVTEELNSAQIKRMLVEIGKHNSELDVTGGEPFLSKHIWDVISVSAQNDVNLNIITKKTFSLREAEKLADAGLRNLSVSIDSSVAENADYLVGIPGFFNKMIGSIKSLVKCGIEVSIKSLVCNLTIDGIEDLIILADEIGINRIVLQDFQPGNFTISNKYLKEVTQYEDILSLSEKNAEYLRKVTQRTASRDIQVLDMTTTNSNAQWEPSQCPITAGVMFVRPDGKAPICGLLQEFVIGDIKEQSLAEIWHSKTVSTLRTPERSLFSNTDCFECIFFDECSRLSRCYGKTLVQQGKLFAPDVDRLCAYFKAEGN